MNRKQNYQSRNNQNHRNNKEALSIFLGGLQGETQNSDVVDYFNGFTDDLSVFLKFKPNGLCAGYGILKVFDQEVFDQIISKIHHIKGRQIECRKYYSSSNFAQYQEKFQNSRIYVTKIPSHCTNGQLKKVFQSVGKVVKAYIIRDNRVCNSYMFGYVVFEKVEDARKAVKMQRFKLGSNVLVCRKFTPKNKYNKDGSNDSEEDGSENSQRGNRRDDSEEGSEEAGIPVLKRRGRGRKRGSQASYGKGSSGSSKDGSRGKWSEGATTEAEKLYTEVLRLRKEVEQANSRLTYNNFMGPANNNACFGFGLQQPQQPFGYPAFGQWGQPGPNPYGVWQQQNQFQTPQFPTQQQMQLSQKLDKIMSEARKIEIMKETGKAINIRTKIKGKVLDNVAAGKLNHISAQNLRLNF